MSQSPFKFLDSYTREDHDIYFGRTNETEALYTSVFKSKMVLLYGVSGTGKSSLIQCGLANKFQESDWLPVFVRRGRDMLDSLFQSLIQTHIEAPRQPKKRSAKSFLKLLQSLYLDHFKPVYLIFDQFEELFIFGNKEERNEFVQLMEALQESEVQVKVIFSIREEYLAMLTEFEDRLPELFQNRIRVERMHFPQAREVIQGACQYAKIEIEEGFEEQLLEKLTGGKKELELTYLQVLLDRLWKKSEEGKNGFTLSLLESMGHISDLLGQFLEEQINELEEPEQGLTVLKTFVSVQGTKKQLTFEEIHQGCLSLGKDVKDSGIQDLLQRFTDLRILRDKDESGRYELRHDSLAAKIYEKITMAEKELMEVRQFVEQAYQLYEKKGIILSKDSLDYIAPYRQRMFLKQKIRDFVDASQHYYVRKAKRRRRILFSSITSIMIIAIVSGIFIWSDLQASRETARIATAHNLANQSLDLLPVDPKQAFKTAVDAYNMEPDFLSKKAVMNAFYQGPFERMKIPFNYNYPTLFDDINMAVYTTQKLGVLRFSGYDLQEGRQKYSVGFSHAGLLNEDYDYVFSGRSKVIHDSLGLISVATNDSIVHFFNPENGKIINRLKFYDQLKSLQNYNGDLIIMSNKSMYKYSYIRSQCIDTLSFDSEVIHCKFIPDNDNPKFAVVVEAVSKDSFRMHKINLQTLSVCLSTRSFSVNDSILNGEKLFFLKNYVIVGFGDEKQKDKYYYVWDLNLNSFAKKITNYSLRWCWGRSSLCEDFLLLTNSQIDLLRYNNNSFSLICGNINDAVIFNDSLLIISKGNKALGKQKIMFYDYNKYTFVDSIVSCKELNYSFYWGVKNGILIYKDVTNNQMCFILNGDLKKRYSISSKFFGDDIVLSKIGKSEFIIYSELNSVHYFIDSLLNIRPILNSGFEMNCENYESNYCDNYFYQNNYANLVNNTFFYALSDFYNYTNAFSKNLRCSLNDFAPINMTSIDTLNASIERDDSLIYVFNDNCSFHRYVEIPDSIKNIEGKNLYVGFIATFDSIAIVSISNTGSFIFHLFNDDKQVFIPRVFRNYFKEEEEKTIYLIDTATIFKLSCADFSVDKELVIENSNQMSLVAGKSRDKLFINDLKNQILYKLNKNGVNDSILSYSINDSLSRLTTGFYRGSVFYYQDDLLIFANYDSLKVYSIESGGVLYAYSLPTDIILDTLFVRKVKNELLIGLDCITIGTSSTLTNYSDHYGVNEYGFVNEYGYVYDTLIRLFNTYDLQKFSQNLCIRSTFDKIHVYNSYFDELLTINFLKSDGVFFDVKSVNVNGYMKLLWRGAVLAPINDQPAKRTTYLLKLPVTVPRMFEILQETGLDTTYGFDNIPKNF